MNYLNEDGQEDSCAEIALGINGVVRNLTTTKGQSIYLAPHPDAFTGAGHSQDAAAEAEVLS